MNEFLKQFQKLQNQGLLEKLQDTFKKNEALTEKINNYVNPRTSFQIPNIPPVRVPNANELNSYQSSGALVKKLADSIIEWRKALPQDQQPVICAILSNGQSINVSCLSEESFHGVKIEGTFNGMPCMVLIHQASLQLFCYVEKIEKEKDRRKIGFILDGERTDL